MGTNGTHPTEHYLSEDSHPFKLRVQVQLLPSKLLWRPNWPFRLLRSGGFRMKQRHRIKTSPKLDISSKQNWSTAKYINQRVRRQILQAACGFGSPHKDMRIPVKAASCEVLKRLKVLLRRHSNQAQSLLARWQSCAATN